MLARRAGTASSNSSLLSYFFWSPLPRQGPQFGRRCNSAAASRFRQLLSPLLLRHSRSGAVLAQLAGRAERSVACALAAALLLYPLLSAGIAPQIDRLWLSRTLAARVAADRAPRDPPVILTGYVEPSLVFLLGTGTRLESGKAAGRLAAQQGGLALVGNNERNQFLDALREAGGHRKLSIR